MGNIKSVEIIEDYAGPVYDIQVAVDASFIVNGIVVHNCTMIPIVPGFDPVQYETGEEWFRRQPESVQKKMMGPGKFKAWKEGRFKFGQLATVKANAIWGPSAQVTSLKDLLRGNGGYAPPLKPKKQLPPFPSLPSANPIPTPLPALDHDVLLNIDMHQVGPDWGFQAHWENQSYGGVIFDDQGRVLLRKPTNNFGGYTWTFPKGHMDSPDEHPVHVALREVEQESGHDCAIIGLVPGQYQAGPGSTVNNFFLMKSNGFDKSKMDWETEDLIWATPAEAKALIKQGANKPGVDRDLAILGAATKMHSDLSTGAASNDYIFKQKGYTPNAIITNFSNATIEKIKKDVVKLADFPKSGWQALADIEHAGKGVAIFTQTGELKALASFVDGEDVFKSEAIWGESNANVKQVLLNLGKMAAKQKKGIVVAMPGGDLGSTAKKAAKAIGFEPGGQNKHYPANQYYLLEDWMPAWKKKPSAFNEIKPELPGTIKQTRKDPGQKSAGAKVPVPPQPAAYDRVHWAGGESLAGDYAGKADAALKKNKSEAGIKAGVAKAINSISGGHQGLTYEKNGEFTGIISFQEQGAILKTSSAAFVDFETNKQALKDVIKIAKAGGKDVVIYGPGGPISAQYKKWGFQVNQDYGNGAASFVLKKQNFDDWLKDPDGYGEKVKSTKPKTTATKPKATPVSPAARTSPDTPKATPKPRQIPPIPNQVGLPEPDDFPPDPLALKVVKQLGGSTGAVLVEDAQGRRYVRKRGNSREHVIMEAHADAAYAAAGANVPRFRLYETEGGPVKLAEYIEGEELGKILKAGGKRADKIRKEVQKTFAVDAILSNRDIVGLGYDNILVTKDDKVYRIDNGGSFQFRAQGALKTDWDEYPSDLWTMRRKPEFQQLHDVFGGLNFYSVCDQIVDLEKRRNKILESVPAEVAEILARRIQNAVDVGVTGQDMQKDKFNETFADDFAQTRVDLRRAGIRDRMSTALTANKTSSRWKTKGETYSTMPVDEDGRAFDNLRGRNSVVADIEEFINKNGGNYDIIKNWGAEQGYDSWYDAPIAKKLWMANISSDNPELDFYWGRQGYKYAVKQLAAVKRQYGADVYDKTNNLYQAFVYEVISNIDFPNRDAKNRTVHLFRTENRDVININKLKPGDKNVVITRGAAESTSIFKPITVHGSELTEQDVPWHRILGVYFTERYAGYGSGPFLGDGENEFLALLKDIPFDYVGR